MEENTTVQQTTRDEKVLLLLRTRLIDAALRAGIASVSDYWFYCREKEKAASFQTTTCTGEKKSIFVFYRIPSTQISNILLNILATQKLTGLEFQSGHVSA
jgi:hypothetical protein